MLLTAQSTAGILAAPHAHGQAVVDEPTWASAIESVVGDLPTRAEGGSWPSYSRTWVQLSEA